MLQCILSPVVVNQASPHATPNSPVVDNQASPHATPNSKEKVGLTPPTIYTKHGCGSNDHDGAILFWHYSGFTNVLDMSEIPNEQVEEFTTICESQNDESLILVRSSSFVWVANPIKFSCDVTMHGILGHVIFPAFDIPNPNFTIQLLNMLKRMDGETPLDYEHRQRQNDQRFPGDLLASYFGIILEPFKLTLDEHHGARFEHFHELPGFNGSGASDAFATIGLLYFQVVHWPKSVVVGFVLLHTDCLLSSSSSLLLLLLLRQ
jgi:hypothetical protein